MITTIIQNFILLVIKTIRNTTCWWFCLQCKNLITFLQKNPNCGYHKWASCKRVCQYSQYLSNIHDICQIFTIFVNIHNICQYFSMIVSVCQYLSISSNLNPKEVEASKIEWIQHQESLGVSKGFGFITQCAFIQELPFSFIFFLKESEVWQGRMSWLKSSKLRKLGLESLTEKPVKLSLLDWTSDLIISQL